MLSSAAQDLVANAGIEGSIMQNLAASKKNNDSLRLGSVVSRFCPQLQHPPPWGIKGEGTMGENTSSPICGGGDDGG